MKTLTLVILSVALLTGCGQENQGKGTQGNSDTVPSGYFAKIKDKKKTVAYVIDLANGFATAYLAKAGLYVTIDTDTGEYEQLPNRRSARVYFSSSDCTEGAIIADFTGELGKTVVKLSNGSYYKIVSGSDYSAVQFDYASFLNFDGECTARVSAVRYETKTAALELTTEPYSFTALGTITLEYE